MSKTLLLARHGGTLTRRRSVRGSNKTNDPRLSETGIDQIFQTRNSLFRRKGYSRDIIICLTSPLKAAEQTAEIILPEKNWQREDLMTPISKPGKLMSEDSRAEALETITSVVTKIIKKTSNNKKAIIVGHEPLLSILLSSYDENLYNLKEGVLLKKGEVVEVIFDDDNNFESFKSIFRPN